MKKLNLEFSSISTYWFMFIIAGAMGAFLIFGQKYLPMMDLPQHANQVVLLKKYLSFNSDIRAFYHLNLFTPYMTGIVLSTILSYIFSPFLSIKIVLFASLLFSILGFRQLIQDFRGDEWWSFIILPVFFGINFLLGHFNFIISIPIGLFVFHYFLKNIEDTSFKDSFQFFLLGIILFFSHAISFGIIMAMCLIHLLLKENLKDKKWKILSLMTLSIFPIIFIYISKNSGDPGFQDPSAAGSTFPIRFLEFISGITSISSDSKALTLSLISLIVFILIGSKGIKTKSITPFLIMICIYFGGPKSIFSVVHYVYPRLVPFVVIFLFLCLIPISEKKHHAIFKISVFVFLTSWFFLLQGKFSKFDKEARNIDVVIAAIEPNHSLLGINYNQGSQFVYGEPYRNFYAWSQFYKGGKLGFSFAMQPPQLVRENPNYYIDNPGYANRIRRGAGIPPLPNDSYDYYLFSSKKDKSQKFFEKINPKPLFQLKAGNWTLYKSAKLELENISNANSKFKN